VAASGASFWVAALAAFVDLDFAGAFEEAAPGLLALRLRVVFFFSSAMGPMLYLLKGYT
jgi:hypothetical protein